MSGFNTPERITQPTESPSFDTPAESIAEQSTDAPLESLTSDPAVDGLQSVSSETAPEIVPVSDVPVSVETHPGTTAAVEETQTSDPTAEQEETPTLQEPIVSSNPEEDSSMNVNRIADPSALEGEAKSDVKAETEDQIEVQVDEAQEQPTSQQKGESSTQLEVKEGGAEDVSMQEETMNGDQTQREQEQTEEAVEVTGEESGAAPSVDFSQPIAPKSSEETTEPPLSDAFTPAATEKEEQPDVKEVASEGVSLSDAAAPSPAVIDPVVSSEIEPVLTSTEMPSSSPKQAEQAPAVSTSSQGAAITTSQPISVVNGSTGNALVTAESSTSGARRQSPSRVSVEGKEKARQEEMLRQQRVNDDMRLMWLSLPANDHFTYYSDTEEDAPGSTSDINNAAPKGAYGGMPLLSRTKSTYTNGKRKRESWLEDERESSDSDDENLESQEKSEERKYRTGNRGNKLLKGARWNRRGKLGLWTEAKNEKEMHDRFMSRVKAIQRAGVESLLYNAPGPKVIQEDGPMARDLLDGSDRMLFKDLSSNSIVEENLQSTSLAPALLRPILSARALLESHTLRHTFRNPHIGALSKTALDLRESEGHLSRALGRCFSAMERTSAYVEDSETGQVRINGSQNTDSQIDLKAIGAEGTAGTADEINPAFLQLDDLFVTKSGLHIPVVSSEGEEQPRQSSETQAILTTDQQRDVVRAALECLQDLGLDSLEYVERLDEVRGRLEAVKRRRTQVWEALRLWAIKRDGGEDDDEEGEVEEEDGLTGVNNSRLTGKPTAVTATSGRRRK